VTVSINRDGDVLLQHAASSQLAQEKRLKKEQSFAPGYLKNSLGWKLALPL
jgi:hypothetical protein